ncbi:MAG: hypothetical protein JWP31_2202, partial [Aeromicrobium sp.]|nr:hypothetical protein [Aeromicrobium sp.]
MPDVRGIGSIFSSDELLGDSEPAPWSAHGSALFVESGGQALRLVAERLWSEGRTHLHLPGYLCVSMIKPFASRPWVVSHVPYDSDVEPQLEQLELMGRPEHAVLVSARYFGRTHPHGAREQLAALRARGVAVVEDRTHNLFTWDDVQADFVVASLRKTLPVGDGALLMGGRWVLAGRGLAGRVKGAPGDAL